MKALLYLFALVAVGCGSKTDEAIADQVAAKEEAPVVATQAPAATPVKVEPTKTVTVPADARKTAELEYLLNLPAYSEWTSTDEAYFRAGCEPEARKTLIALEATRYCSCARIVMEALTVSVETYAENPKHFDSEFIRIGAPQYCVDVARGAKP